MPNFAKLREAWTYLSAIPEEAFSMDVWMSPESPLCGTVACAVGWLMSDPQGKFDIPGFTLEIVHYGETHKVPMCHNESWLNDEPAGHVYAATLFDLTPAEANRLFVALTQDEEESVFLKELTHKAAFHNRLIRFFAMHGETL